ncbi:MULTISPECIES: SDR family oxidoreductase [Brachybacterium]|uniref:SDR family oxidoreductase n=1 Tax=Brachybacterium TaxID=43668 RepID=UPI0006B612B1|nr:MULTISPECIES: SDR family oxidoreductase [Brachybacterium]MCT1437767.1 SDR family oxidoreductase [Brachybacterium paraconglomeratum]MCZ4327896.1 SDR family oxidoreductase [Brachybacterium paraconglomeratum]GAP77410.1 oxidoreductase, short chain dehydrogenase/reductase family [Brachybacterium sp. SW0106-09]
MTEQDPSQDRVLSRVAERAEQLSTSGGEPAFSPQDQEPPGLTGPMSPVPDHGERSYVGHARLEGMAALITGGDSGIGRAVAIAYAREGADVAIAYLPEEQEDAEETRRWIEDAGRRALLLPGDLRDEEHARSLVRRTVEELGRLDVLVNNAAFQWGRAEPKGLEGITSERLRRTLTTNLEVLFWLTQEAAPHLRPGASVINSSSIQSYDPSVPLMDYAATKAAINNLTVNLAGDLGPRGIRVNAVAPGPIWTPLNVATRVPDDYVAFGANTPLGRAGQPAECAGAYVFLASPEEASYVSGTVLGVTGGRPVF